MGDESLPPVRNFSYDNRHKKAPVPLHNERPAQGEKTNKNFIVSNAIENILSMPKKPREDVNWMKKKDFGRTPEYIERIK